MSTSDVVGVCENLEGCKLDVEKKISDEELFKQPTAKEDCPICFLRTPYFHTGSQYQTCCGKVICSGCSHAPRYDNQGNEVDNQKCPFCRTPAPKTIEEALKRLKKRMEVNDAKAMHNIGAYYSRAMNGYSRDYTKALELYHRAAELGCAAACGSIGYAYDYGEGLEIDKKKANHYYELAAIGGSAAARFNLGNNERKAGNMERALKHFLIAVRDGHTASLKEVKQLYTNGYATKDDYTNALQLYQSYLGEIKCVQRDQAAFNNEKYRYY